MKKLLLLTLTTFLTFAFLGCDDLPGGNTDAREYESGGGGGGGSEDTNHFGTTKFSYRYFECAVGDTVCDGMYWYVINHKADFSMAAEDTLDFAFENGGLFLGGLSQGPVTAGMLTGLLKNDTLAVVTLSGTELQALFDFFNIRPQGDNLWPQFSSQVRTTIDYTASLTNPARTALTINGASLDPAKTYRVASGDFSIRAGGMGGRWLYPPLNTAYKAVPSRAVFVDVLVETTAKQYINAQPQPYTPVSDGRITVIGGTKPY
ncbi:hypothetical protein AGMMS49942_28340 [Spirochaetia bacterium]|nr:hypothetical protein AGMMS49942_28340 [Spirochaetia bacterium]